MEITLFSKTIEIEEAPIHIAPDGSELIRLMGRAPFIAKFLDDLKEKIAFGMIKAQEIDEHDRWVWVWTYVGQSDMDEWLETMRQQDRVIDYERRNFKENDEFAMGYSIKTRNEVIEALKVPLKYAY